jgi:hypothetical protein
MKTHPKFICTKHPFNSKHYLIVHSGVPSFIAVAMPTNFTEIDTLRKQYLLKHNQQLFSVGAHTTVNNQLWGIFVVKFFNHNEIDIDPNHTGFNGIMDRTGDWFHAFLKNEM